MTTALLTVLAIIAFAANSIFARLALGEPSIDPASYTMHSALLTGAVTLWLVGRFRQTDISAPSGSSWIPAAMLFLYATTFSFAYINLTTGTSGRPVRGRANNHDRGRPLRRRTALGASLVGASGTDRHHRAGLSGLAGVTAPSAAGSLLMGTAGVPAWGVYSILGRRRDQPGARHRRQYLKTVPLTLIVL